MRKGCESSDLEWPWGLYSVQADVYYIYVGIVKNNDRTFVYDATTIFN